MAGEERKWESADTHYHCLAAWGKCGTHLRRQSQPSLPHLRGQGMKAGRKASLLPRPPSRLAGALASGLGSSLAASQVWPGDQGGRDRDELSLPLALPVPQAPCICPTTPGPYQSQLAWPF